VALYFYLLEAPVSTIGAMKIGVGSEWLYNLAGREESYQIAKLKIVDHWE